jgi:hypothetical protein
VEDGGCQTMGNVGLLVWCLWESFSVKGNVSVGRGSLCAWLLGTPVNSSSTLGVSGSGLDKQRMGC